MKVPAGQHPESSSIKTKCGVLSRNSLNGTHHKIVFEPLQLAKVTQMPKVAAPIGTSLHLSTRKDMLSPTRRMQSLTCVIQVDTESNSNQGLTATDISAAAGDDGDIEVVAG
jgi:hypothetical protein